MTVIACTIELHLPAPSSLKEKRRILKSVIERIQQHFNVSIAEIGDHELWRRAAIGVACVGRDRQPTLRVVDQVLGFIRRNPEVELIRHETQVV
ncbi:MAG TPA: DUF503 domain-containing protein [Nitrospiria bacterium]|nr:DUF503 domain-containing protein [Nitrospiria bacterium]